MTGDIVGRFSTFQVSFSVMKESAFIMMMISLLHNNYLQNRSEIFVLKKPIKIRFFRTAHGWWNWFVEKKAKKDRITNDATQKPLTTDFSDEFRSEKGKGRKLRNNHKIIHFRQSLPGENYAWAHANPWMTHRFPFLILMNNTTLKGWKEKSRKSYKLHSITFIFHKE